MPGPPEPDNSFPIGKPKAPAAKPTQQEWRPHPTDKRFEINAKGQWRTKIDPPPVDISFIWPFAVPAKENLP